jgi:prepilin-type processing-associated H-X9-DG protein
LHGRFPRLPEMSPKRNEPNSYLSWMGLILPQVEQDTLYQISATACIADPDPRHNPPHVGFSTVVRIYVCPDDGISVAPHTDSLGRRAAYTSYIGNEGVADPRTSRAFSGVLGYTPSCRLSDITDGTSQTLMVGERPPPDTLQAGWWYPWWSSDTVGLQGPNNGMLFYQSPFEPLINPCRHPQVAFGPGRVDNPCDRYHLWSYHPGGANFLLADASARFLSYEAESIMVALASRDGGELLVLP